jgi:hypothetical protein
MRRWPPPFSIFFLKRLERWPHPFFLSLSDWRDGHIYPSHSLMDGEVAPPIPRVRNKQGDQCKQKKKEGGMATSILTKIHSSRKRKREGWPPPFLFFLKGMGR